MSEFYKGGKGSVVVLVKFNGVPYSGATVVGDYYKPDDTPFLSAQSFTEIEGATGLYRHTFNIPSDVMEGVYKCYIKATKGLASDSFIDAFTEPDGPASLWTPTGGNWVIENNIYRQTYQHNLPYFSAAGESSWQDITYEADVRGDVGFNYEGLAFRFNHIEDSYLFYLRTGSGNVRLAKAPFVTLVQTPNYSLPLSQGVWYRLKVVVTGANIKCYVNDELQIEYDDPNPIVAGKIGLWCYWTQCSFDNVAATIPGLEINSYTVKDFTVIPALAEASDVLEVQAQVGEVSYQASGIQETVDKLPDNPAESGEYTTLLEAIESVITFIKQVEWGRWKIENNQMIFYGSDGVTPIRTFDLKNKAGKLAEKDIYERIPV